MWGHTLSIKQPRTIEEMLSALYELDKQFPRWHDVPYEESIMLSHSLIADLCERVYLLEAELKGLKQ